MKVRFGRHFVNHTVIGGVNLTKFVVLVNE